MRYAISVTTSSGSTPAASTNRRPNSNRQPRIPFQYLLFEMGHFTRAPELGGVRDTVAERAAVGSLAALDGARDADEFGPYFVVREADRRIAVAAQIDELEMWGEGRIGERPRAGKVEVLRIIQARADAVS